MKRLLPLFTRYRFRLICGRVAPISPHDRAMYRELRHQPALSVPIPRRSAY